VVNGPRFAHAILTTDELPALSPDFVFRGLSLRGFWLINWLREAPRTEIQDVYQTLGDLVADGSRAAVEQVHPLEQFKHSLKSNRSGKNPLQVWGGRLTTADFLHIHLI
jgi:hypothetical protein